MIEPIELFSGVVPFFHVAEQLSFRRAAERLGVSTAAVSKAVARLEVATTGLVGVAAGAVGAISPHQRVDQAFKRGKRRYASVRGGGNAAVVWDVGAGWVIASGSVGARGYTLLATTDVDHDGHLELISYQQWANDYGLDVYGDSTPDPIYGFSCGNI